MVPDLERELERVIDAFTAKGVAYAPCRDLTEFMNPGSDRRRQALGRVARS